MLQGRALLHPETVATVVAGSNPAGVRSLKRCSKCGEEKPPESFSIDRKRKDGKQPWCKSCLAASNKAHNSKPEVKAKAASTMRELRATDSEFRERENAKQRVRRADNPAFKKGQAEYWREFYTDPVNRVARKERTWRNLTDVTRRAKRLLVAAKQRDPTCSVTFDHVLAGVKRGHCAVTGILFDLTREHQKLTGRSRNPYSPSLDRIDCRLGYTNANTRVVITHYNFMKGQLSDEEMVFICRRFLEWGAR